VILGALAGAVNRRRPSQVAVRGVPRIVGDEVGGSGRVELGHLLLDLKREVVVGRDEGRKRLGRQVAGGRRAIRLFEDGRDVKRRDREALLLRRLGERDAEFSFAVPSEVRRRRPPSRGRGRRCVGAATARARLGRSPVTAASRRVLRTRRSPCSSAPTAQNRRPREWGTRPLVPPGCTGDHRGRARRSVWGRALISGGGHKPAVRGPPWWPRVEIAL
jgi:hypothetical protein